MSVRRDDAPRLSASAQQHQQWAEQVRSGIQQLQMVHDPSLAAATGSAVAAFESAAAAAAAEPAPTAATNDVYQLGVDHAGRYVYHHVGTVPAAGNTGQAAQPAVQMLPSSFASSTVDEAQLQAMQEAMNAAGETDAKKCYRKGSGTAAHMLTPDEEMDRLERESYGGHQTKVLGDGNMIGIVKGDEFFVFNETSGVVDADRYPLMAAVVAVVEAASKTALVTGTTMIKESAVLKDGTIVNCTAMRASTDDKFKVSVTAGGVPVYPVITTQWSF